MDYGLEINVSSLLNWLAVFGYISLATFIMWQVFLTKTK